MIVTGETVNDKFRAAGIVVLVDLAGDRLWFYPRGQTPVHLLAYLEIHSGRNIRLLRNYLVNLARGLA